jgi:peptidyl-prolyl cis-trans isomerase C
MFKPYAPILLLALLGAIACGDESAEPEPAVVATVGERKITEDDFLAFLKLKGIPADDAARREQALEQFLERETMADAIAESGKLDEALLQAELREHEKELLINRHFDALLAEKVDDQAIEAFYREHADRYAERKVHVAHILFRTRPNMAEEERRAQLTAAQDAASKLAAGADFGELAGQVSEDRISAKKGGELGWLKEGSIDPKFSAKVFSMGQGETSEPFESSFGFHIVRVLHAPKTVQRPLDAVKGDIRYELRAEAKKAEMERLAERMKVVRPGGEKPAADAEQKTAQR